MPDVKGLTIGVLGGTGPLGGGLARRFAAAGLSVVVGSRDAAKGARIADEILADVPGGAVTGTDKRTAQHTNVSVGPSEAAARTEWTRRAARLHG